jgi:thioredoxin reductase (NADPH)
VSSIGLPSPVLDDNDPTLFPKLTDQQIELLAPLGTIRAIQVGDVLFREGDATYDAMVLMEGTLAVVVGSGETERDLAIQKPRDLMVEFNILTGEPVGATGIVREAGSVLVVPANEFRAILGRELTFGDFVLQTLFRRRSAIQPAAVGHSHRRVALGVALEVGIEPTVRHALDLGYISAV